MPRKGAQKCAPKSSPSNPAPAIPTFQSPKFPPVLARSGCTNPNFGVSEAASGTLRQCEIFWKLLTKTIWHGLQCHAKFALRAPLRVPVPRPKRRGLQASPAVLDSCLGSASRRVAPSASRAAIQCDFLQKKSAARAPHAHRQLPSSRAYRCVFASTRGTVRAREASQNHRLRRRHGGKRCEV